MKIAYIGLKEVKADNVAATGFTWIRGEVHDVADAVKAAKLLEHPLIWADATGKSDIEIAAMMVPAPRALDPVPRLSIIPADEVSPFWEPVIIPVPGDVFTRLQAKELLAVFMTSEDADAYAEWKLERDTAPKETGPEPQAKETKAGLESRKKAA